MIAAQRQQKKNARYKKIPGSGGKGQHDSENHYRTAKEMPKNEDTQKPESAVTVKNEGNVGQDPDLETENKYSKRKVESNASRYREIDDNEYQVETDEQLQARLVQLLNIPKAHMPTMPVFEDEVDSSYEQSIHSSFLALDCNTLVRALKSIPIHKKLNIDEALMDLGDQTHNINPTAPEIVQGAQRTDQKKYPLQPEVLLKKGKPGFQFQLPPPAKMSDEYSHKPREEKKPNMDMAGARKQREDTCNTQIYTNTVTCAVVQPFTAIPDSEAPLRHRSLATELDNVLDGILAL